MTLNLAMESYNVTSKVHMTKEKIDKLGVIKILYVYISKDTIKKVKRQPT